MDLSDRSRTSASLLDRLRRDPGDRESWNEFVERYGRKIYAWCRKWKLQEEDARDVTQDVLLKLSDKMRSFVYDPASSFHGWLKTLTRHAWCDFLDGRRPSVTATGDRDVLELLGSLASRDDLAERLREEEDRERLEAAMSRAQLRVSPQSWEAFRLLALEGRPGAEVAGTLGMNVAAVLMARSRVQARIKAEITRFNERDGD